MCIESPDFLVVTPCPVCGEVQVHSTDPYCSGEGWYECFACHAAWDISTDGFMTLWEKLCPDVFEGLNGVAS